ncbi:hypothetical protein ACFO0M_28065 [Micromonospora mangrovi]|uniref:Uncharacterized protein n=2 Tax=Micromonospora TaxID=1873 RepID=A0AAU7ME35_9ACTN
MNRKAGGIGISDETECASPAQRGNSHQSGQDRAGTEWQMRWPGAIEDHGFVNDRGASGNPNETVALVTH